MFYFSGNIIQKLKFIMIYMKTLLYIHIVKFATEHKLIKRKSTEKRTRLCGELKSGNNTSLRASLETKYRHDLRVASELRYTKYIIYRIQYIYILHPR